MYTTTHDHDFFSVFIVHHTQYLTHIWDIQSRIYIYIFLYKTMPLYHGKLVSTSVYFHLYIGKYVINIELLCP